MKAVNSMELRFCLCAFVLFAGGYAKKSNDYCRVLVNLDTFKTSVNQFLVSWARVGGGTEIGSECRAGSPENMDKRVRDLENKVAHLTSELSVDCGSPTPLEDTDVVYASTGLHAVATYRCKEGFLSIHPGQHMMSLCQKDGNWTMVDVKCVNISGCWTSPAGKALYTGTRSATMTGRVCQRWNAQRPQKHSYKEDMKYWIPGFDIPQTVTGSANYCRDPSRSGYLWCYTTDRNKRWEKCDVPMCNIQG